MNLIGKRAFVTGGSRDIGGAIARTLARAGVDVASAPMNRQGTGYCASGGHFLSVRFSDRASDRHRRRHAGRYALVPKQVHQC